MKRYFEEDRLLKKLSDFEPRARVAFGLICAERLLPNYSKFSREHSWGDIRPLRRALDAAWTWLQDGKGEEAGWKSQIEECEQQAPDTNDFDSIFVSPALDAASVAIELLLMLSQPAAERALDIATFARDTVDMYVQEIESMEPNSSDLEEKIVEHELMQRELALQEESLQFAKNFDVAKAAEKWRNLELSNIGLS